MKDLPDILAQSAEWKLLKSQLEEDAIYQCPGERYSITRTVHWGRLRRQYAKCKECPHRHDIQHFSPEQKQDLSETQSTPHPSSETSLDGFRGVMHNEFHAGRVQEIATGLVRTVEAQRLQDSSSATEPLQILVGHDQHGFSLELTAAAVQKFRELGVTVLDAGMVTAPLMSFLVQRLKAAAGLFLTVGQEQRLIGGADLFGAGGIPLSTESLHRLVEADGSYWRQSRSDGGCQQVDYSQEYIADCLTLFPDVITRSVRVVCENPIVVSCLKEVAAFLRGELIVGSSLQSADESDPACLNQEGSESSPPDLTIEIDPTGQACFLLDRNGDAYTIVDVLSLVLAGKSRHAPVTMLIGEELPDKNEIAQAFPGAQIRYRQSLREPFAHGMRTSQAVVGVDAEHRYWLPVAPPRCDAILTVGEILQAITSLDSGR